MKFKYDNHMCVMLPNPPEPLEFQNLVSGLKIIDNKLHTSFVILKRNDNIGYAQGIVAINGTNVFDVRTAMLIANKVRRMMPRSKYKDFHMFLKGYKQPLNKLEKEDDEILEHIINSYDKNTLNEALGIGVDKIQYSDTKTKGVGMKGLKGALQALPSAIVPFLVCPPMALISLLGAVHNRLTERYLKSKLNAKVWQDYIAMSKSDLKEKVKKAQRQKIQYYYTTLANGEVLKVPAVNTIEAKDMVLAISRKDIEPRYANYDNGYYHVEDDATESGIIDKENKFFETNLCTNSGEKVKMWCVKFNDGQACYAFGNDGQRDEIMKKAIESRKAVIDYYKSVVLKGEKPSKGLKGTDNWKDTKMKHGGIGHDGDDEEYEMLFTVPHVDDMIEISNPNMYFPITRENDRDFSTPQTGQITWQPRKNPSFRIPIGEDDHNPDIIFNIPSSNEEEAGALLGNLTLSNDFKSIIQQQQIIREIVDNCCLNVYSGTEIGFKKLSEYYHTQNKADQAFTIDQFTLNICGHLFNILLFKPSPYVEGLRTNQQRIKQDIAKIREGLTLIGDQRKQNLMYYVYNNDNDFKKVLETLKSVLTTALYNNASKYTKSEMYKQMNNMSLLSNNENSQFVSGDENMDKFSTWNKAAAIFEVKSIGDIDSCEMINPDTDEIINSDITVQLNYKQAM